MKKVLASLLVLCLAFGMVACGSNADDAPAGGGDDVVVENPVDTEPVDEEETQQAEVPEEQDTEVNEEVETPEAPVEDVEKVTYTYADLSQTMYAKSAVNVRDLPSTDGNRLGSLAFAQEVAVTGKCNETGWYRISYGDMVAYVSNNYLLNEKPEPQPVETAPEETPAAPETTLMSSPWELNTPTYYLPWDCMIFYNVVGDDEGYTTACYTARQVLRWHTGREDADTYMTKISQGTFAEGEIMMVIVRLAD